MAHLTNLIKGKFFCIMLNFYYIFIGGIDVSIPSGNINEIKFNSLSLMEEITLLVYIPANYSPLLKYTICIVNDGKDYFQMGRLGRIADQFHHEGMIENTIFVGVPYNNVQDRRSKYHPDGEKQSKYIKFLAHELVPFLDQEFPTYGVGRGRALMGDSLAATVSLMTALQYPHTFGRVIMHSPYVDEKVLNAVQQVEEPDLVQLYHVIGKEEDEVATTDGKRSNFIVPNRALHKVLTEKQFPQFYDEFDGNHTWKHWQKDLPRAIEHMFND